MKRFIGIFMLVPVLVSAEDMAMAFSVETDNRPEASVPAALDKLQTTLTLSDGGVLHGTLQHEFLPIVSDTLGAIRLDFHVIESVTFDPSGGPANIIFRNGDRLTARVSEEVECFQIDTLLGVLTVPLNAVASLSISPGASSDASLLYYCTFDSPASIEHPAAGPAGKVLHAEFDKGKKGLAMRVPKGGTSAIVQFDKGMLQPSGTIEFWAKIENYRDVFGDGGDPRFFMIQTAPSHETVLQFAANDGGGRGGISVYHQGFTAASENHCLYPGRYASILNGDTKGWHHYALVWNANGIPGEGGPEVIAVFIDGHRLPLYGNIGFGEASAMAANFRDNPATLFFSLNPALNRGFNNKTDFLIDEFKIWSVAKTLFDLN